MTTLAANLDATASDFYINAPVSGPAPYYEIGSEVVRVLSYYVVESVGPSPSRVLNPLHWVVQRGAARTAKASHTSGATLTPLYPEIGANPIDTGGGGGAEDALPIADPTSVVIDDTTYPNQWTNVGDYTTAVFPNGGVAVAWAQSGDAFPRVLMMANPLDGFFWSDGTVNPFTQGAAWWILGPDANGNFSQSLEGGGQSVHAVVGDLDANAGYGTNLKGFAGHFRIGAETTQSGSGFTLSAGGGAPAIGGNVGDIYIRQDPGGANQTIYRCTVAGTAGGATWVGIL